jgi:hypothetical protein
MGHAMARPEVGAIFSAERETLPRVAEGFYSPTPISAGSQSLRKLNIAALLPPDSLMREVGG